MKREIHVVYYKGQEFVDNEDNPKSIYSLEKFVEKGNFYLSFINHYNEICEWLENLIEDISNQTEQKISFKRVKPTKEKNLRNIYDYIYSDIKDYYIEDCKKLETFKMLKESIESVKGKLSKEVFEERCGTSLKRIEEYEKGIAQRKNLVKYIEEYLSLIDEHVSRFRFGVLKEVLRSDISLNNAKRLLESSIVIPQKSHILVYEEDGDIKKTDLIYHKYKEEDFKKKSDYFNAIHKFFDNVELNHIERYKISSLKELLDLYYVEVLKDINIKKCKNCGKYFIANNKQIYCDNISPQNIKYTCRTLPDEIRNKDAIYQLYRQRYQSQNNKLNRNIKVGNISEKELSKRFERWNELAILKLEECKQNKISLEQYEQWFKENQNWIKNL